MYEDLKDELEKLGFGIIIKYYDNIGLAIDMSHFTFPDVTATIPETVFGDKTLEEEMHSCIGFYLTNILDHYEEIIDYWE